METSKPLIVVKFGGSVLSNGEDYSRAAEIISELIREYRVVVVVSAMKGVTDSLIKLTDKRLDLEENLSALYARHVNALKEAGVDGSIFSNAFSRISRLFNELTKLLWAVRVLDEVTPKALDYIVSFGERLSAIVMEAVLEARGIRAKALTGWEAGIVTDRNFGNANPIIEETVVRVRSRLPPLLDKGIVPVVTGFIAATPKGEVTTLGRGGSDYTASLLASILDAFEVRFYTDVPGVMTADPKLVPTARTIPKLCVIEALELSRAGGKRFHPRTFEPLLESSIPARILDARNPEGPQTVVQPECDEDNIKAVAVVDGLTRVSVEGTMMVGRVGTAMMVTKAARDANVNIVALSQPVTETRIDIYVQRDDAARFVESLREFFRLERLELRVSRSDGYAAIAIVGYGLSNARLRAEALRIIAELGLPVESISPGFHGASLTILTTSAAARENIQRLHDALVLHEG